MNKALIPILVAAVGIAAHAAPVDAAPQHHGRVEVTSGRFQTLPGGIDQGLDIRGGAIAFRSDFDGGTTAVIVRVHGLAPDTTYKTHVHNAPCSASPAGGGHYQHVVGGAVDAVNEIWPTITTDRKGRDVAWATHGERARDDAQSIVIHDSVNTAIRLACVDLS